MGKKRKIRVSLRKNRQKPPRRPGISPGQIDSQGDLDRLPSDERISRKGELTRKRTIIATDEGLAAPLRDVDLAFCQPGRILIPRGGGCVVQAGDGSIYECAVRRLLKNIANDDRTVVAAGDRVLFRPVAPGQGVVERVEPRQGVLTRKIRGQKQVLAANVDQVLIVASAGDPRLKPSLIDRYLISASAGGIRPIICINKADLANVVELQPIVGVYSQLGYEVLLTSVLTGLGLKRLSFLCRGRESALAGQSGVGKTSLINALEPGLNLKTRDVAVESRKGKHTTTSASLIPLSGGGWVVDTPGIRQMELWDVIPDEVEGYFVEVHPFLRECRFPDCSHRHERGCGVKRAVACGLISLLRYESYCRIRAGEAD
ncbi:MAG: ribosome small subunit-dependent GTPase A [Planctomycetaceae bacterium]